MLVLDSNGFRNIAVRSEISDVIKEKGEKEKDFAVMTGFQKDNINVFDNDNLDEFLNTKFDYIVVSGGNTFQQGAGKQWCNIYGILRRSLSCVP